MLLLQPQALLPDTILIDEPELGFYIPLPSICWSLDVGKEAAELKQVIVSTQSVELLGQVSHFRRGGWPREGRCIGVQTTGCRRVAGLVY